MRAWLDEEYASGRLIIRQGRADRAAFATRFDFSGGTFVTRYPQIRQLFDELDARIVKENYLPATVRAEVGWLNRALVSPVLAKDRRTISWASLEEITGVSEGRLKRAPFVALIDERQRAVDEEVRASRIDPFLHGRVFPFSQLTATFGARFATQIGIRFKQLYGGTAPDTAKGAHMALIEMFQWIGTSADPQCVTVANQATATGRVADADAWEEAVHAYCASQKAGIGRGERQDLRVDSVIKTLRGAIEGLASAQILPPLSMTIAGVKNARRKGGRLRSVAEATRTGSGNADYVEFARSHYAAASARVGADPAEAVIFLSALGSELAQKSDVSADPATAILEILESRLTDIQKAAEHVFETGRAKLEFGRQLVEERADIDVDDFERVYLGDGKQLEKQRLVRRWFPIDGDASERERGVANLLKLIGQRCGGIPPTAEAIDGYGQFFSKRYLDYGGLEEIIPLAIPDASAVGAVLTLYLCESGANVSVGQNLIRDCLEQSDVVGHTCITGMKARAAGKPIIHDMPDDCAAVRAMRWLTEAGRATCASAGEDGHRLFLMRRGGAMQLCTSHWYTAWFKRFCEGQVGLRGNRLTPNMIRPSVLLHAALSNDGRLGVGIALGQHGEAVSQGYQQRWPTRLQYDDNIRRFQTALETLVVSNIAEALDRFNISEDQLQRRLASVRATGLGTFCADPRGRPGQLQGCTSLDCWNDCPNLIVVAEVEAIASLQIWQRSLRAAQPDWERDQPERWDRVWLPWLCLADVVEEKMSRHLIKNWRAAAARADEISSNPAFVAPKPW
jgi:hypothetical protein